RVDRRANYQGGWSGWHMSPSQAASMSGAYFGAGITTLRHPINYDTTSPPASANDTYDANTILNSFHPGGIQVLLTDGSARFMAETIDMALTNQVAVRDDGAVLGEW